MQLVFTIEPFVDGEPGPRVDAAVDAAGPHADAVEVGPFGTSCSTDAARMPQLVAAVVAAALEHGATGLSLRVEDGG